MLSGLAEGVWATRAVLYMQRDAAIGMVLSAKVTVTLITYRPVASRLADFAEVLGFPVSVTKSGAALLTERVVVVDGVSRPVGEGRAHPGRGFPWGQFAG